MHNTICSYSNMYIKTNVKWILTGKYIGDVRPSLMALHSLESISK